MVNTIYAPFKPGFELIDGSQLNTALTYVLNNAAGGGGGTPGGTSGQVQYNNSGVFGGFTLSGDATLNTTSGAITVSKFNGGTSFGTLASQSGTFSGTSSGTNTGDQTISLTGDVTGTGTGSFAATIASSAVTTAKINNSAVTEGKIGLSDVTTNNASTSNHGFVPKLPNDGSRYYDATGAYSYPGTPIGVAPNNMPGVLAWVRPSSLNLADNTQVSTITDSIGGFAFAQATSANQPTLIKDGIAPGCPGLLFGGTLASYQDVQLAGTVSVTNGSAVVTGTSTSFSSTTFANGLLYIAGKDSRPYLIQTVTDNTHITLNGNWQGPTESGLKAYYRPSPVPTTASKLTNATIAADRANWWTQFVFKPLRVYSHTDVVMSWNTGQGTILYLTGATIHYQDNGSDYDFSQTSAPWNGCLQFPKPMVITIIMSGATAKCRVNGRECTLSYSGIAGTMTGAAIGGSYGSSQGSVPGIIGDVVIGTGALTSQQAADGETWLATSNNIAFNPDPSKPLVVFMGDSEEAPLGCTNVTDAVSEKTMAFLGNPSNVQYVNIGYSGAASAALVTQYNAVVLPWVTAARSPVIVSVFEGLNDANPTNYQSIIRRVLATGAYAISHTIPAQALVTGATRATNNAAARTDVLNAPANLFAGYDRVRMCDIGDDPSMALDTTTNSQPAQNVLGPLIYLNTSHWGSGFHEKWAKLRAAKIAPILGIAYPPLIRATTTDGTAKVVEYLYLLDGNYIIAYDMTGNRMDPGGTDSLAIRRHYAVQIILGVSTVTAIGHATGGDVDIVNLVGFTTADATVVASTTGPGVYFKVKGETSKNVAWTGTYQISGGN